MTISDIAAACVFLLGLIILIGACVTAPKYDPPFAPDPSGQIGCLAFISCTMVALAILTNCSA